MGLFSFFTQEKKKNTASLAKERLQILIAHEHSSQSKSTPEYLPKLRDELLVVIRKYVQVDESAVNVKIETGEDFDTLELNIALPEK